MSTPPPPAPSDVELATADEHLTATSAADPQLDAGAPLAVAAEPDPPLDVSAACLNCGADRLGDYCHACGQHHLDDRLTLRVVWREFAERFLKLERGLLATIGLAVRNPGALARRYVGGERRRFVNPVSFLLIGSAIAVLLIPLYASEARMANDPSLLAVQPDSARANAQFELGVRMAGGDPSEMSAEERQEVFEESQEFQQEFMPLYLTTMQQLYSVFSIALALALAGFFKLFFAGRERTYTFAETLVAGFYLAGIYVALSAVISAIVSSFLPLLWASAFTTALLLGLAALTARGFYERTAGAAALGALSGLLALVAYLVSVVVIAIPVVVVKMLLA